MIVTSSLTSVFFTSSDADPSPSRDVTSHSATNCFMKNLLLPQLFAGCLIVTVCSSRAHEKTPRGKAARRWQNRNRLFLLADFQGEVAAADIAERCRDDAIRAGRRGAERDAGIEAFAAVVVFGELLAGGIEQAEERIERLLIGTDHVDDV